MGASVPVAGMWGRARHGAAGGARREDAIFGDGAPVSRRWVSIARYSRMVIPSLDIGQATRDDEGPKNRKRQLPYSGQGNSTAVDLTVQSRAEARKPLGARVW